MAFAFAHHYLPKMHRLIILRIKNSYINHHSSQTLDAIERTKKIVFPYKNDN